MNEPVYVVHFPHPGAEHRPVGDEMPWNQGSHARKFMVTEAMYVDRRETKRCGQVVFWGEWEGPSRVVRQWPTQGDLPRYLHQPYWHQPTVVGARQNTDPWVFGDSFRYSNCKQLTSRKQSSAMQRLTRGTLILFGSGKAGQFVLDTVFVVAEKVGTFVPAEKIQ